jgi:hypothetical protein
MLVFPALYLSGALYCFTVWFKAFQRDTEMTAQQRHFSLKVLSIAVLFWPLVAPLSCLEKWASTPSQDDTHPQPLPHAPEAAIALPSSDASLAIEVKAIC